MVSEADSLCSTRYETVVKRWPIILTNVIDFIHRVNHDLTMDRDASSEEKIQEGKQIIEKISKLKYEMARDRALECVCLPLLLTFVVGGKRSPQLTVVLFIQLVHAAAGPFQTMEKLMWKRTTTNLPRCRRKERVPGSLAPGYMRST